ncbi:aminotransferase class I/II-fold pyridoxal phosphate-dependent enzyme [Sporosarcina sp. ANT_H38]|uniref:aminotransferase class I/II-fold pyridoxal phosphate-dependent enzyme n=1 Tax=Sporosarcina sp. ANT_H38 TaxID=2597358 RepID=UPI0011F19496|nr:aminotransferase class I/II-fold pyridoxal phosphate-dependent enzyme [Sporosarcina sp. ANT_H38]KAA0955611.1 aminotransferase class I/II-fold pyridoxal phosphate-dependent enzyme [Sporosarcina sp. ANT_H38]
MSLTVNPRVQQIEPSGIRKISNQLINYPDAINLTIGQPDFPTPERIKEAAHKAIADDKTAYSHNAGLLELRQAVATFFTTKYGFNYNPQTEIIITTGASEAMDTVFRTILEEGDEVIIPVPIYTGYEPLITLAGATPIYLDTTPTAFIPDPVKLAELITPKTKAIVFNYPSNPTGVTIPPHTMDALAATLAKHDIFIISDEIYSENIFEGEHRSFAQYPGLKDKLFLIHGLSKSHSMTGWRIGFLLAADKWIQQAVKVHAYNTICASVPSQHAAICALTECQHTPAAMNPEYIRRRNYMYMRLTNMQLPTVKPNGAFYIFPSIKEFNQPAEQFAHILLNEAQVAVVPGTAFTAFGEGYIRISYAYAFDQLEVAMDRLENWLTNWRNNERHIVPDPPLV